MKRAAGYSVAEIAALMGTRRDVVYDWIRQGKLIAEPGRPLLIKEADLVGFIKRHGMPMPAALEASPRKS